MSECDCCGYDGTDLPRYRGMMQDVLDGLVDKRTAELKAENQRLREALGAYRGQVDRYGNESASLALLGGGG